MYYSSNEYITHPLKHPWYHYVPLALFLIAIIILCVSLKKYDEDLEDYRNEFWHNDCQIVYSQIVETTCGFNDGHCDPIYNLFCTYLATEPSPNVTQMLLLTSSYDESYIINKQNESCIVNNFVKCYVDKQSENLQLDILDDNEVSSLWILGIVLSSILFGTIGIVYIVPFIINVYRYCLYARNNINSETDQLINP